MPTITHKVSGAVYSYQTLVQLDGTLCLDGNSFIQGTLEDFTALAPAATQVSPVQFKLLFTGPERVGIKKLRADDALLDDFMGIIDDSRLGFVDLTLASTQAGVGYALQELAKAEVITADSVEARTAEILSGVFQ